MSRTPVTLATLLDGLEAELVGCRPTDTLEGLTPDSREAGPGVAFVALAGVRGDGHAYVAKAAAAGAAVIIAQRGCVQAPEVPHVWLADTATALPTLAANFHGWPARALTTYGLTGTNGKTTCSYLLSAILSAAGHPHARLGTTGNLLVDEEVKGAFTTPFPIELQGYLARARRRGATHAIMEVSSHALAQGRVQPIAFDAVAMTSFTQDHLDYHENMRAYLSAKLDLCYAHLRPQGFAVAPVDDNRDAGGQFLTAARDVGARPLALSRNPDAPAPYRARVLEQSAAGTRFELLCRHGSFEISSPLIGDFNVDNLLVAAALALETGIDPEAVRAGLATSAGAPGRLERVEVSGVEGPRVYVDYAHTPDAVERALQVLRRDAPAKLIVLLGCGGDRDRAKRPLMGAAAHAGSDLFWATSDNPRSEDPGHIVDEMIAGLPRDASLRREVDRARAIATAIAEAEPHDCILIAGKGHETTQTIGSQIIEFDDREHARRALAGRAPAP